ncbi:MAG TPA: hypothetical protein PLB01_00315 [Thermoanaerobaculia bacterium]|nr:hypothetical protein [Thermoanaerobaculia bacterium]
MSAIADIEADLVARLLDQIGALSPARGGTCRSVGDVRTATMLDTPPPAVLVQYAGERAEIPAVIGPTRYRQMSRFQWDLKVIAASFTLDGEGREDQQERHGAYTLLDSIFNALEGYRPPNSPHATRFFFQANSPYGLTDASVIYTSSWYCDVLRFKQ